MKKKITSATIVLAALLAIVCFAVRYNCEQRRNACEKAVWETPTSTDFYCIQPGKEFDSDVSSKRSNLWVEYEPDEEVSEELTEIEKGLIEKLSKISIRESEGVTKEEFVTEIERWGSFYNAPLFSENAELLFDIAQEKGYNEYVYPMLAMVESRGGRYLHGEFNSCNLTETIQKKDGTEITAYDKETAKPIFRSFESDEECIREFFEILDGKPYESVTTLTEFTAIWAPNTAKYPHQAEQYAIKMWLAREVVKDVL